MAFQESLVLFVVVTGIFPARGGGEVAFAVKEFDGVLPGKSMREDMCVFFG